jgi:GH18 family chitinase
MRDVVQNAEQSSSVLAKFAGDNNLDGLDIDWEYPGAPDIEGFSRAYPATLSTTSTLLSC